MKREGDGLSKDVGLLARALQLPLEPRMQDPGDLIGVELRKADLARRRKLQLFSHGGRLRVCLRLERRPDQLADPRRHRQHGCRGLEA